MWIPDPIRGDSARLHQPQFGFPEVDGWVTKLKQTAINEIAGYQFARAVGLHVLDSRWFVAEKRLEIPGTRLECGEAGMLIAKITPADAEGIELPELAKTDPQTVARTCALFVLDRGEWAETWKVRGALQLIDLEMMFARFEDRACDRRGRLDDHLAMSQSALEYARKEAARCGVEPEFVLTLTAWHQRAAAGGFSFDFSGHRRGPLVGEFLIESIRMRLTIVMKLLGVPS